MCVCMCVPTCMCVCVLCVLVCISMHECNICCLKSWYGWKLWTPLHDHLQKLDGFHHKCINIVLGIAKKQQWEERISLAIIRRKWSDAKAIVIKLTRHWFTAIGMAGACYRNGWSSFAWVCLDIPYGGKIWQLENLANWLILSIWRKKVWRINRSANKLLIISTNLDGFSLANHWQFAKFTNLSPTKVSLHTVATLTSYDFLWS